jgi:hypothetical protein
MLDNPRYRNPGGKDGNKAVWLRLDVWQYLGMDYLTHRPSCATLVAPHARADFVEMQVSDFVHLKWRSHSVSVGEGAPGPYLHCCLDGPPHATCPTGILCPSFE